MTPSPRLSRLTAHSVIATLLFSTFAISSSFSTSQSSAAPMTQNFSCTNSHKFFTVPPDVSSLTFQVDGGMGAPNNSGAVVNGVLNVVAGTQLMITVGCDADINNPGFPNGGQGAGPSPNSQLWSYSGGGSSSISYFPSHYEILLVVAGAGGGGTTFCNCAGLGNFIGGDSIWHWDEQNPGGRGGTQTAPGAPAVDWDGNPFEAFNQWNTGFMQGGHGNFDVGGGGGGGGYWGGSGGTGGYQNNFGTYLGSGGGGSSYVNPAYTTSQPAPTYGTSSGHGTIRLSWTPDPTTTTSTTTTTTSTTSTTTLPPTTTTTLPPTTTPPPATTTPPQTTTIGDNTPSWSATPQTESSSRLSGTAAFPTTGQGTVMITNEMGFITTARSRSITPRWRTRFYIGQFSMAIKATYREKGRTKRYSCSFAPFGVTKTVRSTDAWRWYQPRRRCVLPKELFQQLTTGRATLTMTGTFQRRWATNNARIRPDRSRIEPRRVNIRINSQLRTRVL